MTNRSISIYLYPNIMSTKGSISFIVFYLTFCSVYILSMDISTDMYGPYDICVESLKHCRGMKKNNISIFNITLVYDEMMRATAISNITILEETGPVLSKASFYKWNGNRFESMLKSPTVVICEKLELRKNLVEIFLDFKTVDSSCILKKGNKFIGDFKTLDFACGLLGKNTFYGRYKIKLMFFTPTANILCFTSIYDITKRNICKDILKTQ